MAPIVAVLLTLGVLFLALWIPSEVLRKAGFSRLWMIAVFITGFLGLIALAFVEWPVERELAWHRLKEGDDSEETIAKAEHYAVRMEDAGDWKTAAMVFAELARRCPEEQAAYYAGCQKRINEKMTAGAIQLPPARLSES